MNTFINNMVTYKAYSYKQIFGMKKDKSYSERQRRGLEGGGAGRWYIWSVHYIFISFKFNTYK